MNPSRALALIRKHCDASAASAWKQWMAERQSQTPAKLPSDRKIMRRICDAIAYSQGARAAQIEKLIETPVFKHAFAGFDPVALARRNPRRILARYWKHLGYFRFKSKIPCIVECAQVLNGIIRDCGSFAIYLQSFGIPRRIRSQAALDQFWQRFDELQHDLKRRRMPFFRSTTSLLQLLLDLDYDSVKPDLIIMRLARRIGIVERETGDRALRECVRFLQAYSIGKSCRASELDLVLLAFGGQTGASQLLTQRFCPPSDPCHHAACPVGANRLCMAHP
jgi:3-methyladenine DNA glycosylase Tag